MRESLFFFSKNYLELEAWCFSITHMRLSASSPYLEAIDSNVYKLPSSLLLLLLFERAVLMFLLFQAVQLNVPFQESWGLG